MVKLAKSFRNFQPFKALVLGDFMLDSYTTGKVKRISPEAPVPVMEVIKNESRPGGAGNVALNLSALGAAVFSLGRIGKDAEGIELKKQLKKTDTTHLFIDPNYTTPLKTRLIADSQQLLRIDSETITLLNPNLEETILEKLPELISQVQVIAISDYGKGFLTPRLIQETLKLAKQHNIATIVDPKGIDFTKYRGATILKPNLLESYAAAKCPLNASLEQVADELINLADYLLITRSQDGISIFDAQKNRTDFPVRSKEVKDVTGAGDTVLAMLCLGLASNLTIYESAQLANIAAGICIEKLGCAQITLPELAQRLLEVDTDTKVFDESHTYALQQALQQENYTLLMLDQGQKMTGALFEAIHKLSRKTNQKLIIYARDTHHEDELISLLSTLSEVGYIILQTESLKHICDTIHPSKVYHLKQEKLLLLDHPKILLSSLHLSK